VKNKVAYYKETVECRHRKSEEGALPYCRTGAESEGNNRPGPLVNAKLSTRTRLLDVILGWEPTQRCKYNTKTNLKALECGNVDWIKLVQNMDQ
jgi:hypothetical protein